MYKNTQLQNIFKVASFAESALILSALVSVISLTAFFAWAITPRKDDIAASSVAGVSNASDFEVTSIYNKRRHSPALTKKDLQNEYNLQVAIKSLNEGQTIIEALHVQNFNKITFSPQIVGNVTDLLDIFIVSNGKEYKVYDQVSGPTEVILESDSTAQQTVFIKYDAKQRINFSFTFNLSIEGLQ